MSKLENFLSDVSKSNTFYKRLIEKNAIVNTGSVKEYPILTRAQLQSNRYNMFSDGYKSKYFSRLLLRQYSSGSSGIPVNVYWDYPDYYASVLSLWRKRLKYYGIHTYDPLVRFTLNAFNIDPEETHVFYLQPAENNLTINLSLIHSDDGFEEIIELISQFKPVWFYAQPYVLGKLMHAYRKYGVQVPDTLKYIESVGEILSDEFKEIVQSFFGVPVANMYGSEEMNGIAYECPNHRMHILDDNVYVECLRDGIISDSGEGDAIITNLNNKAMPLIRYNQGDKIVLIHSSKKCPCGCSSPVIQVIKGRSLNSIKLSNGVEINSFMLIEVMSEVNNQFSDIVYEYKFRYYKSICKLVCYVKLSKDKTGWYQNVKICIEDTFNIKMLHCNEIKFEVKLFETNVCSKKKYLILEIEE